MENIFSQVTSKYGKTVFPLYKARPPFIPFRPFRNGEGFLGILLYDSLEDKVQCHLCGKWFKGLGGHILKKHGIDSQEYKEEVGLNRGTPLTSIGTRKSQQEAALNEYPFKEKVLMEGHEKYFSKHRYTTKRPRKRLQYANSFATCDLQLRSRFNELRKKLGKIPRKEEVPFHATLQRRYGSYNNALRAFNYAPTRYRPNYSKSELLSFIKGYEVLFGNRPKASDFVHNPLFPNPTTYLRNFGSWSKAKELALR